MGISNFLRHICTCSSHVGSNSSTGNRCTCVLCSSPQDHSSSSVVCRSSCDHSSSCDQGSSHCHCCSSVLCSSSREHGSSCVIRILWCPSVRRACNQLCALIREGTVMSC